MYSMLVKVNIVCTYKLKLIYDKLLSVTFPIKTHKPL